MLENWLRDEAQVTLQKTAAAQFREEAKKLDTVIKLGSRIVEKTKCAKKLERTPTLTSWR